MTTDEGMKFAYISAAIEESSYWDPMTEETAEATWDGWIARVRRDAAAEAWTDCVSEASALGWLHAPAALDMLDRNPHEKED